MHVSLDTAWRDRSLVLLLLCVCVTTIVLVTDFCLAKPPRAFEAGKGPDDSRLGPLQGEAGEFPLVPAESPQQWRTRAAHIRRVMRVALGLWPTPTKTPLNAVVHDRRDQGDYTIEKVYFESVPGFFVTGSLYRPKFGQEDGLRRPAVLSPHGHFPGGRFQDEGPDEVRRRIVQGAERFEDGGRSFMQSRCVQLVRMGCVVFHYDMIGYGDSQQISEELVHRFSRTRIKYHQAPADGFYSAAALLRLQNVAGLHALNSIRALDFLTSLPDVDSNRIAVTGGSGGGTQTFMLCALDDRPLVSVPVVIVSTTRQGGCTCENVCGLRLDANNIEFTALHAPKPLLLISADDATRTMGMRGFPELQQHYRVLGAAGNVAHVPLLHFPHNYNTVSRTAMYAFVNRHLKLGLEEPILERPYRRLTRDELTVWDDEHPAPPGGPAFERELLDWLDRDARRQLAECYPHDEPSLARFREQVGGAWKTLLRGLPDDADAKFTPLHTTERQGYDETVGVVRYRDFQGFRAELPVVQLKATTAKKSDSHPVLWIGEAGKTELFMNDGSPTLPVRTLLERGVRVWGVDLLEQGEFLPEKKPLARQRWLPNEEAFADWTYCYNQPLLAHRVQDVLAMLAAVRIEAKAKVRLIGLNRAGIWSAGALLHAHDNVERAVIDTGGFRFDTLHDVYDVEFLPGAVKYGDVPALVALAAPTHLRLVGEEGEGGIVADAYRAAGAESKLDAGPASRADIVKWLLSKP